MSDCKVRNCVYTAGARGYCHSHREAAVARGEFGHPKCLEKGCERVGFVKRLCRVHYDRTRRNGGFGVSWCSIDKCMAYVAKGGMCGKHYERVRAHGSPHAMKRGNNRDGYVDQHGYRMVWAPTHPNAKKPGHIAEHRLVMSQMLERPLLPGENVHHKNGNRLDNRPENLELWLKSQPPGQRGKDLYEWAKEIIRRYESTFGSGARLHAPTDVGDRIEAADEDMAAERRLDLHPRSEGEPDRVVPRRAASGGR